MKFSEKELKAVIAAVPQEEVYVQLQIVDSVSREVESVRIAMRDATSVYEKEMEAQRCRLKEARMSCMHFSTSYQGDPAGGSDSQTTCDTCGASL